MTSEQQTKADLLTLIQGRNQRIAELELLVLDLNRQVEELKNARNNEEKKEKNQWARKER